jgi:CRISPR-associated protein Csm5
MQVRLTTLTPLHIGGREGALIPLEFVVFDGRCAIISETKLARALQERQLIDTFTTWFTDRGRPALRDFLHEHGLLSTDFLERITAYSSPCSIRVSQGLRTFVRDAFNRPFLPGSSLKGAIRTAFLYKLLKELPSERRQTLLEDFVTSRLQDYRQDHRGQRGLRWFQERFRQGFAQRFEADIFQTFTLREGQRRYDPHTDLLRCLRVTDSTPVESHLAHVEEIKIFSAHSAESPKRWSLFAECIPGGQMFVCEMTLDESLVSEFSKSNGQTWLGMDFAQLREWLHNPISTWTEMGHDLWERETQFFRRELRLIEGLPNGREQRVARVGWGAGLLGASVDMLLPDHLLRELRNTLFTQRGEAPAPKSRRLVVQSDHRPISLGWVGVEAVK